MEGFVEDRTGCPDWDPYQNLKLVLLETFLSCVLPLIL